MFHHGPLAFTIFAIHLLRHWVAAIYKGLLVRWKLLHICLQERCDYMWLMGREYFRHTNIRIRFLWLRNMFFFLLSYYCHYFNFVYIEFILFLTNSSLNYKNFWASFHFISFFRYYVLLCFNVTQNWITDSFYYAKK